MAVRTDITKLPGYMAACGQVAEDLRELAQAIRGADDYASHVSEEARERYLQEGLARADRVQAGELTDLSVWQRVNERLTGVCVPLLPPATRGV